MTERLGLIIGNRIYSSWSLRGWLLARQSGLEFDCEVVPLRQPDTAARIRARAPAGKVPALIDGGLVVWDSLAIAEYLAERAPEAGIWPAETAARAVARSACAEMHSGFAALRQAWPMNLKRRGPALAADEAAAADVERIVALWADCRDRFGDGGDYLFGAWSAADAFYAPVVSRFLSYEADIDAAARAYCEAVWSHPYMGEWRAAAESEIWAIEAIDVL
ncbi:glutathione S-transferase family protein [Minwuia thermotolerans]|uniref:Glutathione S-transferase n=1 Tax=Minwuia thermotolerans TaxID=2056226 RepID=A0A2M9G0L7_9PROT|nr:glutathione S-transferase family protein [Minwuia thermotolerans]PJK29261.1 glutathione S-transferase [Minwuia thermotolerans]